MELNERVPRNMHKFSLLMNCKIMKIKLCLVTHLNISHTSSTSYLTLDSKEKLILSSLFISFEILQRKLIDIVVKLTVLKFYVLPELK